MRFAITWVPAALLLLYLGEASLLSRTIPFFRNLLLQECVARRQPAIDGLRGLLALSVFFLHALEWHLRLSTGALFPRTPQLFAQLGVLPVTMFFFITGYVFWTKLLRHVSVPPVPFFKERLGRLGGAYYFACAWMFLLVAIASAFQRTRPPLLLVAECVAWITFLGSGHQINHVPMSLVWLGQAWTLRVEWYFYLSVPFLAWFARTRLRLAGLIAAAAVIATLLGSVHARGLAAFLLELARASFFFLATAFSVGMLVAAMPKPDWLKRAATHWSATLLSFAFLGVTLFAVEPRYGAVESACLAVPFAAIAMGNSWFGLLSSQSALLLGRVSYSFYLLHVLTLATVWMLSARWEQMLLASPLAYWLWAAGAGAIAIVLSAISYRLFEHPFVARHTSPATSDPATDFRLERPRAA